MKRRYLTDWGRSVVVSMLVIAGFVVIGLASYWWHL